MQISIHQTCGYILLILFLCQHMASQQPISVIPKNHEALIEFWETPAVFKTPEAVVYDAERRVLYVSNFNVKGRFISRGDTTADEFISKVKLNGETAIFRFKSGRIEPWISKESIYNPNGICLAEGCLIAGDSRSHSLKSIDPVTGEMTTFTVFPLEDAPGMFDGLRPAGEGGLLTTF